MEERFSQEYIDYILSDEAECLQERWEPKVGDWYTFRPRRTVNLLEGWELKPLIELDPAGRQEKAQVWWLPALWDLLNMIYDAGWRVEAIIFELDRGTYKDLAELMMRAAKLAVKEVSK